MFIIANAMIQTEFACRERQHIVAYLDGLYPDGHLQQAKVNTLRELQFASADASQVAPVLWAPSGVDIILEPFGYAQDKLRE